MSQHAPTLYPGTRFRDAPAMIAFLVEAFGFSERQVIANEDGTIAHAELSYGPSILMLGSARSPNDFSRPPLDLFVYVAVDDPDEHCARARAAGAEIVAEPFDTDYGSRDYSARDPEGNTWHFGTYRPTVEGAPASAAA
jgi:uncharacterized glyoxalase superfamily protein PhnB